MGMMALAGPGPDGSRDARRTPRSCRSQISGPPDQSASTVRHLATHRLDRAADPRPVHPSHGHPSIGVAAEAAPAGDTKGSRRFQF